MAITNSYLTSTKNLESIINSVINAKAPERFTNKFLEDLGYKSSNDRLVIGKIKWHTHRGTSMINYVDFADLANIMGQNYDLFEVHIVSLEWAKQIFTTLEKSRNVIMHSGELGERDIERIGINIRDWISQVGA